MSLSNKELWEQGKEMLESLGIHDECPQGDDLFQGTRAFTGNPLILND